MKKYFININGQQIGPLDREELLSHTISTNTPVWYEGLPTWQPLGSMPEVAGLLPVPVPPPFPPQPPPLVSVAPRSDYRQVEDIAGVDYKLAMILTGALLVLSILMPTIALSWPGMVVFSILAVGSWFYFKAYFESKKDKETARWIWVMIAAQIFYCLTYIYAKTANLVVLGIGLFQFLWNNGDDSGIFARELTGTVGMVVSMALFAAFLNFIAGLKILLVNHRYTFPLKRIAISAMFLLPAFNIAMFSAGVFQEDVPSLFFRVILSLPFILLFHHFYRAETEDATP